MTILTSTGCGPVIFSRRESRFDQESLNDPDSRNWQLELESRSITESRLAGFPNNVKATYDPAVTDNDNNTVPMPYRI